MSCLHSSQGSHWTGVWPHFSPSSSELSTPHKRQAEPKIRLHVSHRQKSAQAHSVHLHFPRRCYPAEAVHNQSVTDPSGVSARGKQLSRRQKSTTPTSLNSSSVQLRTEFLSGSELGSVINIWIPIENPILNHFVVHCALPLQWNITTNQNQFLLASSSTNTWSAVAKCPQNTCDSLTRIFKLTFLPEIIVSTWKRKYWFY